jgi:3-phenylpropionate/trans-cinnamate dioxygenase ferredoxin subunit
MYNYLKVDPSQLEFVPVADEKDLLPGERLFITIGDTSIIVFNLAGQLYAIGDVCSHDGNILDDALLEGYEVHCPRHGARFDIRNGKVLSMPAIVDIPAYPVRVKDGQIEVGVAINA